MSNEKIVHKNLEHLGKEIYEFVYGHSPPIINDFFFFCET